MVWQLTDAPEVHVLNQWTYHSAYGRGHEGEYELIQLEYRLRH